MQSIYDASYEAFDLREKIKGHEEQLVRPDKGTVSMVVPMALSELVQVVVDGDVVKPSSQGHFHYFPVRKILQYAGNDVLAQQFLQAGIDFQKLGFTQTDTDQEMAKIGGQMSMGDTIKEAGEIARQFYRSFAAFIYVDHALWGDANLNYFRVNIIGNDPDELLKFYQANKDSPRMIPLLERASELGYKEADLENIFRNAGLVQPVLVGIQVQGQKALGQTLQATMNTLVDEWVNDSGVVFWETNNHTGVTSGRSSAFSRDLMIKMIHAPGEHERKFLESIQR